MSLDEVVKAIKDSKMEDIPNIVEAAISRYRELYPQWQILFISAEVDATDQKGGELLRLIREANEIIAK